MECAPNAHIFQNSIASHTIPLEMEMVHDSEKSIVFCEIYRVTIRFQVDYWNTNFFSIEAT